MKVQLNIIPFVFTLAAFYFTKLVIYGQLQEHISFAGSLNEMATAMFGLFFTIAGLVFSFDPIPKKKCNCS
jgi:hypothetical protein